MYALYEKYKIPIYIIGFVIVLVLIGWISNSFPRQSVLDKYIEQEKTKIIEKYETDMITKNNEIKEKNNKIQDLNNRVLSSEKEVSKLMATIQTLEEKKKNVQKPKTNTEIKSRFDSLGYPVIK
jgi:peptidoglycan hydrolase CwlO-like protein